ncbi:hypothetical protein M422DRAFT_241412 [Sphaerobolus stellatus SS14]|nr:hypothetical protein M422DRAFT_241412 [Sphaerobolus stellatus SS14]
MQARYASSFHDDQTPLNPDIKIILPPAVEPFSDSKTNTPPTPLTRDALAAMDIASEEITTATNTNDSPFGSSPDSSHLSSKSPGLPPPGLAPPPSSFVPQLFYEAVRNTQPPVSCQTPSSTGATRGEDSGDAPDDHSRPVTQMPTPRDGPSGQEVPEDSSPSTRPPPRQSTSAPHQRSFPRHSLPSQPSFYQTRSAPPQEQYPAPSAYPHPGQGFMGQYMTSQPPHSMPLQSPVAFYSTPFVHPGIHAHDPSAMGLPFPPPPPLGRTFTYAAPAPTEDESRSSQGYGPGPPSPFAPPTGSAQPAAGGSNTPQTSGSQFSPQHAFGPPMHFSPNPSPAHYGYPSHSYAQPSPGLFSYAPGYPQTFYTQPATPVSPEDPNKGGTWWYLPPSTNSQQYDPPPYPGLYPVQGYQQPMQMTSRPEFDRSYPSTSSAAGPSGQGQSTQHGYTSRQRESNFPPASPVLPSPIGRMGLSPQAGTPNPPSSSHSLASPAQSKRRDNSPPSRKAYHPAPPPNRSEWVMWVGNVPADATHDELYRFFNQPEPQHPAPPGISAVLSSRLVHPPSSPIPDDRWGGVSSVFLISRSNCAFINFETEQYLNSAVAHFNGKPLRPKDPRCPRLVCRVRRRDDDLRAGVGGQRGMGLHTRWVEEQRKNAKGKGKDREGLEDEHVDGPPTSPSTYLAASSASDPSPPIPAMSAVDESQFVPISSGSSPEDVSKKPRHGSSGDRSRASGASTNSSFLARHFPQRFFILKSLSQHDLNLSVERGVWATQPHNEGVLDQAYRTSQDVFLIFGANKSGEFFGYAKMTGPIFHNERVDQPPWAPRASGRRESSPIEEEDETSESRLPFLSPTSERPLQESPAAMTPGQEKAHQLKIDTHPVKRRIGFPVEREMVTAPAEPDAGHKRLTRPTMQQLSETDPDIEKFTTNARGFTFDGKFVLKTPGPRPTGHIVHSTSGVMHRFDGADIHPRADEYEGGIAEHLRSEQGDEEQDGAKEKEGWGREFKIQWIRIDRLPFHRTRHLRNPWNHDREVKVSRDGTELEPTVGQRLLEEWDKPDTTAASTTAASPPPTSPVAAAASPVRSSRGLRAPVRAGAGSTSTQGMPSFSQMSHAGGSSQKHGSRSGQ